MKNYLSLVKFSHTIFALPFACIGFFLASDKQATLGYSSSDLASTCWLFLKVILCMVFARSAAMAFNRYVDRSIDEKNPRTAQREIPAGVISPTNAFYFVLVNSILFIVTTLSINNLCFFLSPIALAVILGYSYTKRFTALCHFVLGLGLALAPIGAYIAVSGVFDEGSITAIIFSFVVLFWVSGFDIIYALQDEEFDKSLGLNSIPASLGKNRALILSNLLHLITAALVLFAGYYNNFGWLYWIACFIFISLLFYQHIIVKPNDLSKVDLAFFTTNGIASALFSILVILDILY
jgi:4-hydroxybenzoate polyprenyltransferase